jgi:uncharacterized integral membrane protein (TIGR00698 family)
MNANETTSKPGSWEKILFGVPINDSPKLIPGMLAVSVLTWISIRTSEFIGTELMGFDKSPISAVMVAIVLGLLTGAVIQLPKSLTPGLKFSVKKVLRLGIILLGVRLTVFDVFNLGIYGIPIVALCIFAALLITTIINNRLNLPERLGTLIAVGTSICGVTAIVAASPAIDAEEEESAYAVTVITIFGLFATLFYPYLANMIFTGSALQSGMFLGTSVHETAQVVGAGQIFADVFSQPAALDVATVTKLVRNVFMALVIPFMAYYYARKARVKGGKFYGQRTSFSKLFPMFIIGFILMAALRSIGDAGINSDGLAFGLWQSATWDQIIGGIKNWAEIFLVAALAAVGLNTNFRSFRSLGARPFLVGLGASLAVGLVSYLAIQLFGGWVTF